MMLHRSSRNLRVLLVEDESMVSMLAEDILTDAGCTVLLAMRLPEALNMAQTAQFDLAILDVNLGGGQTSYAVADVLMGRGIPFAFATGYAFGGLDTRFDGIIRLQTPYTPQTLLALLSHIAIQPI